MAMTSTPKTIQIFLPEGDPQGIRVAEITTRIVQVTEVPRSLLSSYVKMPESQAVALYFLVGSSDIGEEPTVYVGQTGDLSARLTHHNRDKDFWERALIVTSRTQSLTQTHALFLEWHALQAIKQAGRYTDTNGNTGSRPHTPAPMEADCLEVFDTAKTLLATLGYPLFDSVSKRDDGADTAQTFYCTGSDADGRGQYTTEGFVVLKGSSGRKEGAPSLADQSFGRLRQELIDSGQLSINADRLAFTKDHLFRSPSAAAAVLMGCSANGWIEWKSKDGKTLDELVRQTEAGAD